MAAYAGLAFLSFLWGSSFLLIKIASRAFDPFAFRARARGRRGGRDAADEHAFGQGLAGIATGTVGQTFCARSDWAGDSLLAARPSGDADDERRHGADDGRSAHLRLSVRPLSRIARPLDVARGLWPGARLRGGRSRILVAGRAQPAPTPSSGGASLWRQAFPMEQARSSLAPRRGRSAQSER